MRASNRSGTFWTKRRVIEGLKRFFHRFGKAPSSSVEVTKMGDPYRTGDNRAFPSGAVIFLHFSSMYDAWKATGIEEVLPRCKCGAIKRSYTSRGCPVCNAKSQSEGLRRKWSTKKKYNFTPEVDDEIRRVYREEKTNRKAMPVRKLAERLGLPRWRVSRRAREIGCAYHTVKGRDWLPEEMEILERFAFLTPLYISKRLREAGYDRTEMAVHLKLNRLKLRKETPYYTGRQLAKLFGEDDHKIMRWGREGLMPFQRKGSTRTRKQGGDTKLFHEIDVYLFLINYRDYYDVRKVNQQWLLSVLIDLPAARGVEIAERRRALADGKPDEVPIYSNSKWKERKKPGRPREKAQL